MRFNSTELADFASPAGEHEGRLTHKPPPRTLYDTAYKERWFKLRANLLFYYRLNEFGGVDKDEPSGVFVLENCEVKREENCDVPFGFAIQWKDDPERKHLFFAQSEQSVHTWVNKIVQASYEHLRAQLIMLRVQIRRKTGKDPLEHCGTPLPQRASWSQDYSHLNSIQELQISRLATTRSSSAPPNNAVTTTTTASDSKFSLPLKSPRLFRRSPVPPPRRPKHVATENGFVNASDSSSNVGQHKASFRSHLNESHDNAASSRKSSFKSHLGGKQTTKSSFKSHLND